MKASDLISAKFLTQYPESFKIFEDSCNYTVKHGLNFIKGILLTREKSVSYGEFSTISEQLQAYFKNLGYDNVIITANDNFLTKKGYEHGCVFVIFLSVAFLENYIKESNTYSKKTKIIKLYRAFRCHQSRRKAFSRLAILRG